MSNCAFCINQPLDALSGRKNSSDTLRFFPSQHNQQLRPFTTKISARTRAVGAVVRSNLDSNNLKTQPVKQHKEQECPVDRDDFPILSTRVNDKPLIYFDSAATSQKPRVVIDKVCQYYEKLNSNVHRGAHTLASLATSEFESTRDKLAKMLGVANRDELIYVRNATEGLNLIANAWGRRQLKEGDVIYVSEMEHHANLVPWQIIANDTGATIRKIPLTAAMDGYDIDALIKQLSSSSDNVKLVTLNHVSNVLGCVTDVKDVIQRIRRSYSAEDLCFVVDACQSVPHMPVNIDEMGADFVVASGHKMLGPTGIGFIWGRYSHLSTMSPFLYGGEMIQDVYFTHSTFTAPPHRFEAGTPSIGETVALGTAVDYLEDIGMSRVHAYESYLAQYLYQRLSEFEQVDIYGPPANVERAALCSFNVRDIHSGDLATVLDLDGVAIRSGHHCAQPLHRALSVQSSARASLYVYNTKEEIDKFIKCLGESVGLLGGELTLKRL